MLLFTGGLQYPVPSALAGAVWIASKVAYSHGYYTGGTNTRSGAGGFIVFNFVKFPHRSQEPHARQFRLRWPFDVARSFNHVRR